MDTKTKTPILHIYTYKLRDALARLNYKKPHVLLFKDVTTVATNGVTVWLPREFHGHRLDALKPSKMARKIAHSLIHQAALQLAYRASKEIRDAVMQTEIDSRISNLALRIHAENMARAFWPRKIERKIDTFAKKLERRAIMPKLIVALATARHNGNQREVNYAILSICHLASAYQPMSVKKQIKKRDGTILTIVESNDELKMVKRFATLRGKKFGFRDLANFIRSTPTYTNWSNSTARPLMNTIAAANLGMLPDMDLARFANERGEDADYGLEDYRASIMNYEESRNPLSYGSGGIGYGVEASLADDEDDTVTVDAGDTSLVSLEGLETTLLSRALDDALLMQYKNYKKARGKAIPAAILLARDISLKLKNSSKVTRLTGVVDKLDIEKMLGQGRVDESVFYAERVTHLPGKNRSVGLFVDISGSMSGGKIAIAMTAAQAIAIALQSTGGYCAGGLFNGLGFADHDMSDAPLFRSNPYGVTGGTSFQFVSEVWQRLPNSLIIIITDGAGVLPFVIKQEDRDRTYVICLEGGMISQMEELGHVMELNKLSDLPKVITDLII